MIPKSNTLLQFSEIANPFVTGQQTFFTNHQKWLIARSLDCQTGSPVFFLKDVYGISYTVTEFIIENLDHEFQLALNELTLAEDQQKLIHMYLQRRLNHATPYQVHIERRDKKYFIRFGDYGLKGGVEELEVVKGAAFLFSLVQVGYGIHLTVNGKLGGAVLMSSGVAGGVYVWKTDENERKYTTTEYVKNTVQGVIGSLITGGFNKLAEENVSTVAKMGCQILGAAASGAASGVVSEITDKANSEITIQTVLSQARRKAVSGGVGGSVGTLIGSLTNTWTSIPTVSEMPDIPCELFDNLFERVFKKTVEMAVISGSSKFATSSYENFQEQDPIKRKSLRTQVTEAWESACIGGVLGGISVFAEQQKKIEEYNQAKHQVEQTQKDVKAAEAQRMQRESNVRKLEMLLKKQEQNLVNKQQDLNNSANHVQKGDLHASGQALLKAQHQVNQYKQAVIAAQNSLQVAEQHLLTITQCAQEVQKSYAQFLSTIDRDIQNHLNRGYKIKIGGRYSSNYEEIRNAYLQSEKIVWKKGHTKETLKVNSSPLIERNIQVQTQVKAAQDKIQRLQSTFEHNVNRLKTAEGQLNLRQEAAAQVQKLKVVHLDQYRQASSQLDQRRRVLQEESQKMQEALNQAKHLTALSKVQQEAILKAYENYENLFYAPPKWQYLNLDRGVLEGAFEVEPVSFVEADCKLEELIPHVVLVHALVHTNPPDSIVGELCTKKTEMEQLLFYLQNVVTSNGTIGHHLDLKNREFDENLVDRPHIHWSWNQLVQPNGGKDIHDEPINNWESARIALLEPLSSFEDGIYYKPYGVAPYDTLTLSSHRFSEKSSLLVPQSFLDQVKIHLTGFRGRVIPFDDQKVLRLAVMEALQKHYPETWHMCDEQGNLLGNKVEYQDAGHNSHTYIKTSDCRVICLIHGSGTDSSTQQRSEAIKKWNQDQRYIGLHVNGVTCWIEKEKKHNEKYIKALRNFKQNRSVVKNHLSFAGNIHDIDGLTEWGTLMAFKDYRDAKKYHSNTGIQDVVNYVITEAIYADLVSIFYHRFPEKEFYFSILDLKIIFDIARPYLFNLLEKIQMNLDSGDQKQNVMDLFKSVNEVSYCSILKESLVGIQKAEEETLRKLSKLETSNSQTEKKTKPLCLREGQNEWEKIEVPSDTIEFDLGKNWPYTNQFRQYANQVIRTLPSDIENLEQLYERVVSYSYGVIQSSEERKEQYRINIICSMIQWRLKEKIYLALKNPLINCSSILSNQLSKQIGWFKEYGLETMDFTRNTGDCLFDNVIAQLGNVNFTSLELRKAVVKYMQEHSNIFSVHLMYSENKLPIGYGGEFLVFEDWKQYLACMSQPSVWATELEINALASHLECPIVVLTVGMQPKIYNSESIHFPIFLHHINGNHFESTIPFKGLKINEVYDFIKSQPYY